MVSSTLLPAAAIASVEVNSPRVPSFNIGGARLPVTTAEAVAVVTFVAVAITTWLGWRRSWLCEESRFSYGSKGKPEPSYECSCRPWTMIPGRIPLLGNAWQIVGGLAGLYQQLHQWANEYGQEQGAYELSLWFGTQFLVICRHDLILQLVQNHRPHDLVRSNKAKSVATGMGAGKGLFAAEGKQWSMDRRLVAPALNRKNIRCLYHDAMKTVAQRLVNKWSTSFGTTTATTTTSTNKNRHIVGPIHKDLYAVSIDILSLAVYGKDSNLLEGESPSDKTSQDVIALLDLAVTRMFCPIPYWDLPIFGPYIDGGGWIKNRILRTLNQMIAQQQQHQQQGDDTDCSTNRKTFLTKLLALNQESNDSMPRERLIGQLLTLFLGGSDSVGTLLATAVWQVAADPELQAILVEELRETFGSPISCSKNIHTVTRSAVQDATLDDFMTKLPCMRAFLMEIIRCHGPLPIIFLAAAKDIVLDVGDDDKDEKAVISKGTEVLLLTQYASTHPTAPPDQIPFGPNGEDASQFCPQRWLVEEEACCDDQDDSEGGERCRARRTQLQVPPVQSGIHMAFGHGARMCPGKEFAELEVMTCLAFVLCKFKIALVLDEEESHDMLQHTNRSLHDVRIVLEERALN